MTLTQLPRGRVVITIGPYRSCNLKPEQHASACATVIQFRVGDRDAKYLQILKGMEVADVPADADVPSKVADRAAADVPTEFVVVGFKQAAQRHFRVRL